MKQLIVLIATVVLGIAIAGMIMGFKSTAQTLTGKTTTAIEDVFSGAGLTN